MTICATCLKIMQITKTGRYVRFGGGHCYSGDEYACPKCGATIVVCGKALDGVRTLLIESNHDEEILNAGPHPQKVKERCLGPLGHLSNNQVAEFIAHEMPASVKRLILGHVSKVANDPKLAYAVAKRAVDRRGLNCSVEVACA